jgi:hypothetical protein
MTHMRQHQFLISAGIILLAVSFSVPAHAQDRYRDDGYGQDERGRDDEQREREEYRSRRHSDPTWMVPGSDPDLDRVEPLPRRMRRPEYDGDGNPG